MSESFIKHFRVRFAHCDPAGIVFYPRYAEMLDNTVEDWWRKGLELPVESMIAQRFAFPTVHLSIDFMRPARVGDLLSAHLTVLKIGSSSIRLRIRFLDTDAENKECLSAQIVLAALDLDTMRATPIRPDLRDSIAVFLAPAEAT